MRDTQRALIERARQALSPSEGDEARVFAAVEGRLFALPASEDRGDAGSGTGGATGAGAGSSATAWGRVSGSSWTAKAVLALVIASGAGIGLRIASRGSRAEQTPTIVHGPAPRVEPAPANGEPASAHGAVPATHVEPPSAAAAINERPATVAEAASAPRPVAARPPAHARARARSRARETASGPAADDGASSLRPELEALQLAERALREHQPALALEILQGCERRVGAGHMREERLAVSTVARCALSADQRANLVAEFMGAFAASAYAERVRRSCAARE